MDGSCSRRGGDEQYIKIFVEIPEGKGPFAIPRHGCEDNVIMDLKEIVWEFVDWIHVAQDRTSGKLL